MKGNASGILFTVTGLLCFILLGSSCQQDAGEEAGARQAFHARRADVLATFRPCGRSATTDLAALVAESLCLPFSVPENYAEPGGRQIDLMLMVIPSLSDLPEPDPLFLMAGGPGQAATDLLPAAPVFNRIRTDRDIVLLDQRGTGDLSPFDCQLDEEEARELALRDPGVDELLAIQLQVLRDCLANMDADPAFYTTDIAMRDLDAVRAFLGYSSINLWGASYGSRSALAYLQAYPETTRTVIVDAIAPPSLSLPLYTARDASASLEKLLTDCANAADCNRAFPDLETHYRELLDRLAQPQPVTVTNYSENSTIEGSIADYEFMNFIRQVLYSREAQRLIPLIIEQAWEGNFLPVFALAENYAETAINQGMFLSVVCNEDVTLINDDDRAREAGTDYLLETVLFNDFIYAACDIWPKRQVPATYFEPVNANRPVLIFSGTLDPITPPVWGERVQAALPDSLHLVLEGFGHGTLFTGCTAGIMNDFIDAASLDGLDTTCVSDFRRRPFFVTPGGSTLADD